MQVFVFNILYVLRFWIPTEESNFVLSCKKIKELKSFRYFRLDKSRFMYTIPKRASSCVFHPSSDPWEISPYACVYTFKICVYAAAMFSLSLSSLLLLQCGISVVHRVYAYNRANENKTITLRVHKTKKKKKQWMDVLII